MRPKSIAPSDIRFAETPKNFIPRKPTSIDSGITAATRARRVRPSGRRTGPGRRGATLRAGSSHRVRGPVDDLALVVERDDASPSAGSRRSRPPRLHALGDLLAVLALEHDDHAPDLSPLPSRVTAPSRGISPTFTSATSAPRPGRCGPWPARPARDPRPGGEAQPADGVALGAVLDEAAAERRVVVRERRQDLTEREAEAVQLARVDEDVELLRLAAPRVHLADAAHGAQARADVPVVQRLLRPSRRRRRPRRGTGRSRRRRSPPGPAPARSPRGCGRGRRHPLGHELPGEVDRHASSKTMVTMERPNFESERTSCARGTPISAVSIG